MRLRFFRAAVGALAVCANPALAHHSYAMFDTSRTAELRGSVAKLEWANPHVFLWVYVEKPGEPGKHDLYAFESGSVGLLTRVGWTKDMFEPGERLSIHYFPLKDGRHGGQLLKAVRADGTEVSDPFSPQAQRELAK